MNDFKLKYKEKQDLNFINDFKLKYKNNYDVNIINITNA